MPPRVTHERKPADVAGGDTPCIEKIRLVPVVPFFLEIKVKGHDLPSQTLRLHNRQNDPGYSQVLGPSRFRGGNQSPVSSPQIVSRLARDLDALT